jgi:hypothetical protein
MRERSDSKGDMRDRRWNRYAVAASAMKEDGWEEREDESEVESVEEDEQSVKSEEQMGGVVRPQRVQV